MNQSDFDAAIARRCRHPRDCERVALVAAQRMQLTVTLAEAEMLWQWFSDCADASWLDVAAYSEEEIVAAITNFVERDW